MKSFIRIQTEWFISAAAWIAVVAALCGVFDNLTRGYSRSVSHFFAAAGFTLISTSYLLLWVLLVIAPFRPRSDFSLRGECKIRAINLFLTLGGLLAVHIYVMLVMWFGLM